MSIPLEFSVVIAKLHTPGDIYNLMKCNSFMKDVFSDDTGDAHLSLIIQFSFPQARQFQKNLTNFEYYSLLNNISNKFSPWGLPNSNIYYNSDFTLNGNVINYNILSYAQSTYSVSGPAMKINATHPVNRFLYFLLANKIDIDPSKKHITVRHLQWMLDHGFVLTPKLTELILKSFDTMKIRLLLSKIYGLTPEHVKILYTGPTGPNASSVTSREKRELFEFLYNGDVRWISEDFLFNGNYVDFSYDIIYSMDPSLFNDLELSTKNEYLYKNLLSIVKWMVRNKRKILKKDVEEVYRLADIHRYLSTPDPEKFKEAFIHLIKNGYFPPKNMFPAILAREDEDVWNIMRDKGADFTKINIESIGRHTSNYESINDKAVSWLIENNFL